jgi:hypothetical protein
MKKFYFFIFLFLSLYSESQSWCMPGATWHYKDNYLILNGYRKGVTELKFTNTVTINSIVCGEIARTFTGVVNNPNNNPTVINYQPIRTYSNNGVYYIYDSGANVFDTLCNFNASIGDKWRKPWNGGGACHDLVSVVDTGHILVGAFSLKMIVLSGSWSGNDTVVERIAGFNHFFTTYAICVTDYPPHPDLMCYVDDNFILYKKTPSLNCFYDVSINELEKLNSVYLSPNPFRDVFIINSSIGNLIINQVEIVNTLGQKVFEVKQQKVNVSIQVELPKGLYIINLEAQGQKRSYRVIKN